METKDLILAFALGGAHQSGMTNGTHDQTVGNVFRGAFPAANACGLVATTAELRQLRDMFVTGYLSTIPKHGVLTNDKGVVVLDTSTRG